MLMVFMSSSVYSSTPVKDEYKKLIEIFFDAVRVGHVGVVNEFLTNGFPVDQRNGKSYTPLMVAAYSGQTKMVDILVAGGADACATDKRGNTALMGALFKGELGIVKKLYGIECDPNATNNAGQTLDDFAEMFGKQEFLQSLGS